MIDAREAVRRAFEELLREGKRPYFQTVPELSAKILVQESQGAITYDEAYDEVRHVLFEMEANGELEGSIEPKVTCKLKRALLDYNVRSIAGRKIEAALRARQQEFGYKAAEIHSEAIKHGSPSGSAHKQLIRDACTTELRERAKVAWDALHGIAVELRLQRSRETA